VIPGRAPPAPGPDFDEIGMSNQPSGRQLWYVPDAYLPGDSSHGVESHESACLLNTGAADAHVRFTFYFEDREPVGPVEVLLAARRTRHLRLTDAAALSGVELPRDVPFAYAVESDVPIVVQHSRLDTSAGAYTLATTVAHGE
jgi:hypothetical protein